MISQAWATLPEVRFRKEKIQIAERIIYVEVAETEAQHERGLMYRKVLPPNEGMLFVFKNESTRYFWMKNTYVDLSIGYFDANKTLVDIQEMKAVTSVMEERPPTYPSQKPAQYALEMPKEWFKKNKIKLGAKLKRF